MSWAACACIRATPLPFHCKLVLWAAAAPSVPSHSAGLSLPCRQSYLHSQLLDYGVPEANIMGIRYGFKGFYDRKHKPVTLTRR